LTFAIFKLTCSRTGTKTVIEFPKIPKLESTALEKLQEQMRVIDENMKRLSNGDGLQNLKRQFETMGQVAQNLPPRLNFPKFALPKLGFVESKTSSKITSTDDLGKIVKAARMDATLNQQQLADIAGVGRRFISELENGKQSLELGKVLNVASVLGIDLIASSR
jgi:y4mF family transcriptional regulator